MFVQLNLIENVFVNASVNFSDEDWQKIILNEHFLRMETK